LLNRNTGGNKMEEILRTPGVTVKYFITMKGIKCLKKYLLNGEQVDEILGTYENFLQPPPEEGEEGEENLPPPPKKMPIEMEAEDYRRLIDVLYENISNEYSEKEKQKLMQKFSINQTGFFMMVYIPNHIFRDIWENTPIELTKYFKDTDYNKYLENGNYIIPYYELVKLRPDRISDEKILGIDSDKIEELQRMKQIDYDLKGELFPHQQQSIEWMKTVEDTEEFNFRGGILSLTQGLGKTLTALNYAINNRGDFPQLVITNKSIIPEWIKAVKRFYPEFFNRVYILHKEYSTDLSALTRRKIMNYDLVITTYDVVSYSFREFLIESDIIYRQILIQNFAIEDDTLQINTDPINLQLRTFLQTNNTKIIGKFILFFTPWYRIFADESQKFANPETLFYRSMMSLYGSYKWCLTGTPIRNQQLDVYSQLRWCGFDVEGFRNADSWDEYVSYHYKENRINERWILSMDYAQAGVEIVRKLRTTISVPFEDPREKRIYDAVFANIAAIVNRIILKRRYKRKLYYSILLAAIQRLRMVCVAPHVIARKPHYKRHLPSSDSEPNSDSDSDSETKSEAKDDSDDISNEWENLYNGDLIEINNSEDNLSEWLEDINGTAGINSTKNRKVVQTIFETVPEGEKILVFSSFVTLLVISQHAVVEYQNQENVEKVDVFMITGELSIGERRNRLQQFQSTPNKAVLFMGYKVGAEGLNITEANHVIMLEPWWNYATQAQAESRAWRTGQTKDVHIYDITITNTIESHVLVICDRKRNITAEMIGETDSIVSDETRLTLEDIFARLGIFDPSN
jgi:SNF2 family DNA or RNA helicase